MNRIEISICELEEKYPRTFPEILKALENIESENQINKLNQINKFTHVVSINNNEDFWEFYMLVMMKIFMYGNILDQKNILK